MRKAEDHEGTSVHHTGTYMPNCKENDPANQYRSKDSGEDTSPECTAIKGGDKVNGHPIHWKAPVP